MLGTTDYVSPEQALGHDVTGQSDLYSLGIVLYEMLTGSVPFRGENQVAVAMKHVREELPDVQTLRPEVSASLAAVIDRATAKDLHERYRSDEELIADLEDVLALEAARAGSATGEATTVLRTLPSKTRRRIPLRVRSRPAWIAVAALLVVVALVGGILLLGDRTHRGTGTEKTAGGAARSTPVGLNSDAAHDYDPLGDSAEHADQTRVRDRQQPGDGLDDRVLHDRRPAEGRRRHRARRGRPARSSASCACARRRPASPPRSTSRAPTRCRTRSPTPAGSSSPPSRPSSSKQTIDLDTAGQRSRWVLLWITALPPDEDRVEISELSLYR